MKNAVEIYFDNINQNPVHQIALAYQQKETISLAMQHNLLNHIFMLKDPYYNGFVQPNLRTDFILDIAQNQNTKQYDEYLLNSYYASFAEWKRQPDIINIFLFRFAYKKDQHKNIYEYLGVTNTQQSNENMLHLLTKHGAHFLKAIHQIHQSCIYTLHISNSYPYPFGKGKQAEIASQYVLILSANLLSDLLFLPKMGEWLTNANIEEKQMLVNLIDDVCMTLDSVYGITIQEPITSLNQAFSKVKQMMSSLDKPVLDFILERMDNWCRTNKNTFLGVNGAQIIKQHVYLQSTQK